MRDNPYVYSQHILSEKLLTCTALEPRTITLPRPYFHEDQRKGLKTASQKFGWKYWYVAQD